MNRTHPLAPVMIERLARLVRSAENESSLNPAQWEALRYLDRANRFSNSPGALARYLGATKGTVSQTVMALERKGLIAKSMRSGEKRSVALSLTRRGKVKLKEDPWHELATDAAALDAATARHLDLAFSKLLQTALRRGSYPTFGQCRTCRHFGRNRASGEPDGPHRCLLLDLALRETDTAKICIEHQPSNELR
jgi:DNA-binding MarR family transcriptional regulator